MNSQYCVSHPDRMSIISKELSEFLTTRMVPYAHGCNWDAHIHIECYGSNQPLLIIFKACSMEGNIYLVLQIWSETHGWELIGFRVEPLTIIDHAPMDDPIPMKYGQYKLNSVVIKDKERTQYCK